MDISSLFMASPIFGGYSNFLNNFGSALGANLVTYPLQKKMAKRQYEYQLRLQQQAQAHQINMYKHQHQWRVEDLRAAGLNPILSTHAASGMPSASSGSVGLGSPSVGSSSALNIDSFARLFNNRYKKENDLLDAQIYSAKAKADSDKALAEKYFADAKQTKAFTPPREDEIYNKSKSIFSSVSSALGKKLGDMLFDKKSDYAFDPEWERRKLDRDLKDTGVRILNKNGSHRRTYIDSKGKISSKKFK